MNYLKYYVHIAGCEIHTVEYDIVACVHVQCVFISNTNELSENLIHIEIHTVA